MIFYNRSTCRCKRLLQCLSIRTFVLFHVITLTFLLCNQHALVVNLIIPVKAWFYLNLAKLNQDNYEVFHLPEKPLNSHSNRRDTLILLWKPPFNKVASNGFLYEDCSFTYDQNAIDIADAVVFHFQETPDSPDSLPLHRRNPEQMWLWLSQEAPGSTLSSGKTLTPLNGIFNWTMTYRFDSDIFTPYGSISILPTNLWTRSRTEILAKKSATALGIAVVSNCASSVRNQALEEISKYISVELYGKCYGRSLCKGTCQSETISTYKFYFAFENSRCDYYITEKFWTNAIMSNALPVVMGPPREHYEMIAPKNSFIHVDDFVSFTELAMYLKDLSENDDAYMKFFEWRENSPNSQIPVPGQHSYMPEGFLDSIKYKSLAFFLLCNKLKNRNTTESRVVEHLDTWWYGEGYTPSSGNVTACKGLEMANEKTSRKAAIWYSIFFLITLCMFCYQNQKHKGLNNYGN